MHLVSLDFGRGGFDPRTTYSGYRQITPDEEKDIAELRRLKEAKGSLALEDIGGRAYLFLPGGALANSF